MDRLDDIKERVQRPIIIRNFRYRKATEEEALMIAEALERETGMNYTDQGEILLKTEYLSILDNYVPDSPGWTGKMAVYVAGTHEASYTFRFTNEGAEVVNTPNPY